MQISASVTEPHIHQDGANERKKGGGEGKKEWLDDDVANTMQLHTLKWLFHVNFTFLKKLLGNCIFLYPNETITCMFL
jgi:hypothetical protein